MLALAQCRPLAPVGATPYHETTIFRSGVGWEPELAVEPLRVVLIDDSETDLLFTQIVLERCGMAVVVQPFERARDALAALSTGGAGRVDVILLDINMPGMDGFEFLDAYEALDPAARAGGVVVMLTSSPDLRDRDRAAGYRCVRGYAIKPIDSETARELVRFARA
jgi:CheY-like chemotaxis protein